MSSQISDTPEFNYSLFFELSPDLLCIAGFDGYFKKINAAVSKLLGYSLEELYSKPINDFVFPEDQTFTNQVRKELTKARPLSNFENRYLTKTGEIVWLSWTSLPIESENMVFAIAKNITHKKMLEEERNNILTSLTKANEDLKQLTYTTSHDLRSPVNNLLSIISLLNKSKITDPSTLKVLRLLKLSGENLRDLLGNYVDVLTEKHDSHAPLEEVDLDQSLKGVLKSISSLSESAKATINFDFSKVGKVEFNKIYMESIFLNLITNSIKFSRPDCYPEISIHSEIQNGKTQLVIRDNGLGFDMEKVKDRIFGLHQKFHEHTDSKGIGLYLVHSHVTNLGGLIKVESRVNEGTTFWITLKK
jgi:PAS domain S-box-containing protein